MGGVSTDSGDSLNIELNLVPFIDLLSSLVLFLLITAVWVQISAIPTGIDAKGATPIVTAESSNLVSIHLAEDGHSIQWPATLKGADKLPTHVVKKAGEYDLSALTDILVAIVKEGVNPLVAVSAEDKVEYGEVVKTIDTLKVGGVDSVALSTN